MKVALHGLRANFADPESQGPTAYADQLEIDHPEIESQIARADALVAVESFHNYIFAS